VLSDNMSCHDSSLHVLPPLEEKGKIHFRIALAGNPNVGKSVVFNNLTGSSQVVGNWPGKTVSKAEGRTMWGDYVFDMIDLPGIYSLSTYSLEEIVSREYLVEQHPDYVINVVDSNHLERNLYFTLQLIMLGRPMILSLNQYDTLKHRGYEIDADKLADLLGVTVIPTVAVHNRGVHELLENVIDHYKTKSIRHPKQYEFGKEVEQRLKQLISLFEHYYPNHVYPSRFAAMKLLENDQPCIESLRLEENNGKPDLLALADKMRHELEELHGEQISTVLNSEIFKIAHDITDQVLILKQESRGQKVLNFVDHLTIHSFMGYIILFSILLGAYAVIFLFGDWFSGLVDALFETWSPSAAAFFGSEQSWQYKIFWNGIVGGLLGGIGGVLPYIIPFYFFLEILQDTGYLPRAAYLMDKFLHKIGVHGKTIIPMLLGFGCNVPAVTASMIMETESEKRRAILISSMIPCAAVTTIVLGLVGKHLGIQYALLLYVVNFAVIIIIGRILTKMEHCETSELIIEFHDFRKPNLNILLKQTWHRSKEFIYMALPLIIVFGISIEILMQFSILEPINKILAPVIVGILGLPVGIGIYLFYGVFRKELNLVLLELFVTSIGLSMTAYLSPIQMIVFTMVTMLYVPCVATIVVIKRHTSAKYAGQIFALQMGLAVGIAGLVRWIYVASEAIFPNLSPFTYLGLTFTVFFLLVMIFLVFWEKKKKITV
jgi:ferrous iron transport protein B